MSGKHPAARDFFAAGPESPMTSAFSEWIRRGAEKIALVSKELLTHSCSWRFWAKTPSGEVLACGVVRNSCDSVGRPFPFLLMGTGRLDGWQKNWDLLPFACEGLWSQMEQLAAKKYDSLSLLQEDLSLLRPPQSRWDELKNRREEMTGSRGTEDEFGASPLSLDCDHPFFHPLQGSETADLFFRISSLHFAMRKSMNGVPNSLFLGGHAEDPRLAFFLRPLGTNDFERMWVPGSNSAVG